MDEEIEEVMREIDEQLLEGVARWDSAPMLAGIAKAHFKLFTACNKNAEKLRGSPDHTQENCPVCHQMDELSSEALQHGIVTITFSAFALEAHINEYGSRRLSATYFERFIDKLDTISKWMVIPRLVCGKEISRDSQPFQYLVELFRLRNKIVHPKAKDVDLTELAGDKEPFGIREHNLLFEFVPDAIRALESLADEARRLDPSDPLFGRFLR
ncbi:MAG TPA: hypothetical protein VJ739_00775 [Gemmataceae bacterium]|nr:hypothetical protein [Gemmataceae bacterium]